MKIQAVVRRWSTPGHHNHKMGYGHHGGHRWVALGCQYGCIRRAFQSKAPTTNLSTDVAKLDQNCDEKQLMPEMEEEV